MTPSGGSGLALLRLYAPAELASDGYPREWHRAPCDLCAGQGKVDGYKAGAFLGELACPACRGSGRRGIKHIVRAIAGDRCVRCGHPYRTEACGCRGEWSPCDAHCAHDGPTRYRLYCQAPYVPTHAPTTSGVEAQWRILTVHHLDGDKANCRWWNLPALCQRCHLQIQGKVQMACVWPWEHTDWFKPYVAGYYAHVYLGEDLDREQTIARLVELLALERQDEGAVQT